MTFQWHTIHPITILMWKLLCKTLLAAAVGVTSMLLRCCTTTPSRGCERPVSWVEEIFLNKGGGYEGCFEFCCWLCITRTTSILFLFLLHQWIGMAGPKTKGTWITRVLDINLSFQSPLEWDKSMNGPDQRHVNGFGDWVGLLELCTLPWLSNSPPLHTETATAVLLFFSQT